MPLNLDFFMQRLFTKIVFRKPQIFRVPQCFSYALGDALKYFLEKRTGWVGSVAGVTVLVISLNTLAQPAVSIDPEGLGSSFLSESILKKWMVAPEKFLKSDIESMLRKQSGAEALTVVTAERTGFACRHGVLSCAYTGFLIYRLSDVPPQNATRGHMKINFAVRVVSSNPIEVIVNTKEEVMH